MTIVAKGASVAVDWLGELEQVPLAEVIRRIVFEERSGVLHVTVVDAVKTLHFDRGFIVFASSNIKSDSLGERLISSGRISPHEFALVKMLAQSGKRSFRQAISHAGIVPEEELGRHVAAQVNQIVLSLFSWNEGTYRFEESPCSIPLELMVSLSAHRILLEGIRRMSSGKLILAGLPPLDTMIRVVQAPPFSLDFAKLRPVEKAVLRIADTRISIREILGRAGGDKGKVLRACYALYASGVLESVNENLRKAPRRVQEETGTFVVSEILRKIAPREDAKQKTETARPIAKNDEQGSQVGALQSPASQESPLPPQAEPEPALPALKSFEEFEAEQAATLGDVSSSAGEPGKGIWTRSFAALVGAVTALWAGLATACRGAKLLWNELRGSVRESGTEPENAEPESSSEDFAPATETLHSPEGAPLSPQSRQAPADPVGQKDTSEGPSLPSWSALDDPRDAPLPVIDPVEFLKQSDEGPEITKLGVPKWSLRDDPDEAPAPPTDTYQEAPAQRAPRTERFEPPAWSLEDVRRYPIEDPAPSGGKALVSPPRTTHDKSADIGLELEDDEPAGTVPGEHAESELVLGIEDEEPSWEPRPEVASPVEVDEMFADLLSADGIAPSTQELFIELEPDEDTASSMLNAIPVEDVHAEDEPDLVIVIEEDAFEDLPDVPEESVPLPVPEADAVQPKPVKAKKQAKAKKKRAKTETPAPIETAKPASRPAPAKQPSPPSIVPKVEAPGDAPLSEPAAAPRFSEAPRPSFNEAPLVEAPDEALPAVRAASPVSPESPTSPGRQAPPAPSSGKTVASPAAHQAPTPSRHAETPKTQPAVGATEKQPAAGGPDGEAAASEGQMRARRVQQGGGEERILRDVKLHFKVQDWAGAVRLLEELIHIAPGSALYRGMLARAMSRHPTLRSDAEEHFLEALRLAPQDPEIHYWLGVYYLSFGLKARAINEFKTTLRIDPKHERARQQMSGGRGGGGGGVFKKLFG